VGVKIGPVRSFLSSLIVLAGTAFAQDQSASAPPCLVGQKLEFRYDDGRAFSREISREAELCVVNTESTKFYYEQDWVLVKVFEPNGKIYVSWEPYTHTDIGQAWMNFPFQVGRTWNKNRNRYKTERGVRVFDYNIQSRYNVLAYEEITVPAGTFKTFKIKHEQTETTNGNKHSGVRYLWYAPEVGYYAKREADASSDKNYWEKEPGYELVSITPPK
jgi:uncharacterized protein DUF3108